MMYLWQPQMIRFMRDASENCGYYAELARRIARHLPTEAHVCDAGCGLGYLSLELSKLCRHVSGVDIAPQALEVLRRNALRLCCSNISIIEGDIAQYPPETPYDAMVYCFFGKTDEVLRITKKQCAGKAIFITRNWEKHRFTLADKPLEHNTLTTIRERLCSLGIRFTSEAFALEMGQPFRSLADAALFFRIYSRDADSQNITEENILDRLIRQPSEKFPYYLPCKKDLGMILLDVGDIPDTID